jgi:hypothetical protein
MAARPNPSNLIRVMPAKGRELVSANLLRLTCSGSLVSERSMVRQGLSG